MNSYEYPNEDGYEERRIDPATGSLWYHSTDNNHPYIIAEIDGIQYAISLQDGNPYAIYDDDYRNPFGDNYEEFDLLDEPVTLTPGSSPDDFDL